MTPAPEPKPQECWEIHDQHGQRWSTGLTRDEAMYAIGRGGIEEGWTIRRVLVTPVSDKGGE